MVLQMPRPFKHPKTGVYYFRVRVPVDLVTQFGKSEVKISLRTKDPTLAKQRFSEKQREFEARCKAFRAKPEVLPHRQIVALAGKLYLEFMAPLEDEPGEPEHWRRVLDIGDAVYANEDKMERWYGPTIDELLQREGLAIDATSRSRLLHEGHTALKQAAEQQLRRSQGDYRPDPNAGRFPELASAHSTKGQVTLSDLFKLWERDHAANGNAPRTVSDYRQKLDEFIKFLGHEDAKAVSPKDVAAFADHLRHERGLTAKTVGAKYLAVIKRLYSVGKKKVVIEKDPAAQVVVEVPKRRRSRPSGFTDTEVKSILSMALGPPSSFGRMAELNRLACKWVPWICAYTGARAGELTQLRKEDFFKEAGIDCIRITPEAGSVKSGNFRIVPLHPHLVELGLLEFVASRPDGYVFFDYQHRKRKPGHTQAASVRGKVSDWVRDFVKITDERVQPNHAWRHRFKTVARDVDIAQEYMDVIQGHEDGRAASDYGETTVKAMYREICKLPRYNIEAGLGSDRLESDVTE
ncbi:DUF6538 domain-containing protein [Agrobacterium deltaense]|uniref:DUF6538 domain-containing protein n=1 Tax=Agrobacterium deltaense TaxID=1183412 RepID=UPI000F64005B|nr:DUF6538 domain-containing protein [Agrobacterium deltaense]RRN76003.1 integrase [Agrobacterium deltaense]